MARSTQDAIAVLRGMQMVVEAVVRERRELCKHLWSNSSVREILEKNYKDSADFLYKTSQNPVEELKKLQRLVQETSERTSVVTEGLKQLGLAKVRQELKMTQNPLKEFVRSTELGQDATASGTHKNGKESQLHTDAANLDIANITLKELEEILSKRSKNREVSLRTKHTASKLVQDHKESDVTTKYTSSKPLIPQTVSPSASTSPKPYTSEISKANTGPKNLQADTEYVENMMKIVAGASESSAPDNKNVEVPVLSKVAKQRKVPSSRIGRMASFGGLFAGLGFGTIGELTKGALGLGGSKNVREAFLSPANAERIVDTLCKVRGAALKIGQILSIQDSNIVSPQLAKAFERVRQAADYMPDWQVDRVMTSQIGPDWRDKLSVFDDKPFAAASIGQVHRATLKNGMNVAIKIQYPGVAKSIESDIDNLVGMMRVWDVFPQGFFIDNVVKVAKRELNWEVDYTREAEYTEKFKEMIAPYEEYYVPIVVQELTTSSVLTTELVPGVPLDKCFGLEYDHRKHIAESVLKLCLRELFELQCMQSDPNWSNFLYDIETRRLMLIDFGATRFYPKKFIKSYRDVIICAAQNDRDGVLRISREMGFLTGYETKQMEEAHVEAVMILGELFRYDGEFDFGQQNTTERIAYLVPTMVAHRLCPPPEEIYSIHRKLSGIFLLCARLNVKLDCRHLFEDIVIGKFKE